MHDVDVRGPPQQILVPSVLADVGPRLPRGLIAHLITDGVAEVLVDVELEGRVPGDRRGYLHRAVVIVADSRPLNGDLAEDRLEGERSCPPALDAGAAFAVPVLRDQFLVGLLNESLEEPALNFQTSLMNDRLELVREMFVLGPVSACVG